MGLCTSRYRARIPINWGRHPVIKIDFHAGRQQWLPHPTSLEPFDNLSYLPFFCFANSLSLFFFSFSRAESGTLSGLFLSGYMPVKQNRDRSPPLRLTSLQCSPSAEPADCATPSEPSTISEPFLTDMAMHHRPKPQWVRPSLSFGG